MRLADIPYFPRERADPQNVRRNPCRLVEVAARYLTFDIWAARELLLRIHFRKLVVKSIIGLHAPIGPINLMQDLFIVLVGPQLSCAGRVWAVVSYIVITRAQDF